MRRILFVGLLTLALLPVVSFAQDEASIRREIWVMYHYNEVLDSLLPLCGADGSEKVVCFRSWECAYYDPLEVAFTVRNLGGTYFVTVRRPEAESIRRSLLDLATANPKPTLRRAKKEIRIVENTYSSVGCPKINEFMNELALMKYGFPNMDAILLDPTHYEFRFNNYMANLAIDTRDPESDAVKWANNFLAYLATCQSGQKGP